MQTLEKDYCCLVLANDICGDKVHNVRNAMNRMELNEL